MGNKYNFEKALYFTKCSVYLVCTWPPSRTATKWEIMKFNIAWFISFTSCLCLCIPLIFSIYVYRHDLLIVTQSVGFLGAVLNPLIKASVFHAHRKRTQLGWWSMKCLRMFTVSQILIEEMENFLKNLRPHERIVLQMYIDRFWSLHTFVAGVNYIATCLMLVGPLIVHDQPFPTFAVYPFNVESDIVTCLIYTHQVVAGLQSASGITTDCQAALIMWFAGARLEILAEELADVTDATEFQLFVKKHKKLISYADEISDTMSYIAFASSMTCGVVAIMGALMLVGNVPITVRIKFGIASLLGTINVFVSAWPADNLINVCDLLANAVYSTSWFEMPPHMMKNLLILLRRCQQPIVVAIGGFLPTLSLRSYASFLSGLFSYFTALRVVMTSEN